MELSPEQDLEKKVDEMFDRTDKQYFDILNAVLIAVRENYDKNLDRLI